MTLPDVPNDQSLYIIHFDALHFLKLIDIPLLLEVGHR
jgi:hypothetical protein